MVARVHGVEAAARVPATASAFVAMLIAASHVGQGVLLMWLLAGVLSAERTARPFFPVFLPAADVILRGASFWASALLAQSSAQAIERNPARAPSTGAPILVGHRPSTIRSAGRILIPGNGRIVERGAHHKLIAPRPACSRLITSEEIF